MKVPGLADPVIHSCIEDIGIGRAHLDLGATRFFVIRQPGGQFIPSCAAVSGFKQAASTRVSPEMAYGRHVNNVRICRVSGDTGDLMGLLKPHIDKCFPTVGRLVDSVTPTAAVAVVGLAGADPDDIGIALKKSHVTDRAASIVVKNRRPSDAGIGRFKHAS